jgi:hypothetical protein
MTGAIAAGDAIPLTQWPRDALSFRLLGFAEARFAFVGRVAQHSPHRRSFPASFSRSCRNSSLIQQTRNRADAKPLLGVNRKHHSDHLCFAFYHLVIRG